MSDEPVPIFIVGCSRSGTGLLRNLLRSHPRLAFPNESHFIPRLFRAYGDPRTDREARRLAATILSLSWVKSWGLSLEPAQFAPYRSYREVVSRIFEEWARWQGKPRWGDKTPEYITEIPALLELFPSCRILHIYRDGRDVALSWMEHAQGAKNLLTAATYWKHRVSTGRDVGARLRSDTYLEVRYETLLSRPRETMQGVCEFLDEPFAEEVLAPTVHPYDPDPAIFGTRKYLVPAGEILNANRGKWKQAMSLSDRVLFESVAGDLLRGLGYETEGLGRRITGLERFGWRVHHRSLFLLGRLNTGRKRRWLPTSLRMWWADVRARLRSAGLLGAPTGEAMTEAAGGSCSTT
jgi:hypothetical protein